MLRGIDEQVAKAEKAVDGQAPIKRNRFIQLAGDAHSVNWDLEAKAGKFIRTARRYRTIEIQAAEHTITAADPLPTDLSEALDAITGTHRLAH